MNGISFGKFGGQAGIGFALVGLLALGVGINGTRSQVSVLAQMPYLISGGMLGLALVILAARDARGAERARRTGPCWRSSSTSSPRRSWKVQRRPARAPRTPGDVSGLVVAGTASYHAPTCRLVDGREETSYLTPAEAREREPEGVPRLPAGVGRHRRQRPLAQPTSGRSPTEADQLGGRSPRGGSPQEAAASPR